MSRNKILERREVLEAALKTVNYQIRELRKYYSREQVRCWRLHRNKLSAQLKALPTPEQVKQHGRKTTALVKSIIHRK